MREFPKVSALVALVFGAIAVSLPLQIVSAYNYSSLDFVDALGKLSVLNYLIMGVSLLNVFLVLRLSPILKWTVPAQFLLIAWNNAIAGYAGINTSMGAAQAATLLFAGFCSVFLFEPFRSLLQEPGQRWWLTPRRMKMNLSVIANAPLGLSFRSRTFDLSKDGLFIELDSQIIKELSNVLNHGTVLDLRIKLNHLQVLPVRACVVRISPHRGRYPSGIGLQFINLNSYQRRIIAELLDHRLPIIEDAA